MIKKLIGLIISLAAIVCILYISYSFYINDALLLALVSITATFYIIFSWLIALITKKL